MHKHFFIGSGTFYNQHFIVKTWIIEDNIKHKSIQLCFGQWVCTFLLYRVLGGKHKERVIQFMINASYGYVLFLHCFEECSLCFWGGTVYFIGKDDVCEYGSPD